MAKQVVCPTETTLAVIAGRWKILVIYWLLKGDRRFNQLQRELKGISHRTLATQLREMEADGLVERRALKRSPPQVEYHLTELGRTLEDLLVAMQSWAIKHGERVARRKPGAMLQIMTPH
jgi:DNA-binding HxlR family transcriptional regulator